MVSDAEILVGAGDAMVRIQSLRWKGRHWSVHVWGFHCIMEILWKEDCAFK